MVIISFGISKYEFEPRTKGVLLCDWRGLKLEDMSQHYLFSLWKCFLLCFCSQKCTIFTGVKDLVWLWSTFYYSLVHIYDNLLFKIISITDFKRLVCRKLWPLKGSLWRCVFYRLLKKSITKKKTKKSKKLLKKNWNYCWKMNLKN